MTGVGGEKFDMGPVPSAFITGEGYRMIFRLLKKGPVTLEIEIANSFSDKPVEVYNTVGEIKGTEKPEEVVVVGGHLDSWDLGTGSTDNGTGSMAVLEAARTLAKLNLKPKRTIRFVLFSGEEEGLVGSIEYVKAHKAEMDNVSGVLIHDSGTGRVLAIGMHDNYQARAIVDQVIAPLHELKMLEPTMTREFGTDSLSFDEAGAPGFYTHGASLMLGEGAGAKLTPQAIHAVIDPIRKDVHQVQPHAISITNATEYGMAYTPDEVAAIGEMARDKGLGLHMDGARFANAVARLGCSPADATWRSGIDIMSFGATNSGL